MTLLDELLLAALAGGVPSRRDERLVRGPLLPLGAGASPPIADNGNHYQLVAEDAARRCNDAERRCDELIKAVERAALRMGVLSPVADVKRRGAL